jgi:hypothetical protein
MLWLAWEQSFELRRDIVQPLTLHLTRGVLASDLDKTRKMHNEFVDGGPQPGREIARALGDLSHNVYTPAQGVDGAPAASSNELLFVDYWADPQAMETFFAHPAALDASDGLFTSREEAEWACAPDGFSFYVPAPHSAPPRYLGVIRASVQSADAASASIGSLVAEGLGTARRRGQLSHTLFIRNADTVAQRPAANTRREHQETLPQLGGPVEVLALQWWSTLDGLVEHYRDEAAVGEFQHALNGPADVAAWQQAPSFSEW